MKLLNLSKEKKKVTVELSSDELVVLCNCMYYTDRQNDLNLNNQFGYELYADMMAIRDLCQYGHIDGFCFGQMQKYKKTKEYRKK